MAQAGCCACEIHGSQTARQKFATDESVFVTVPVVPASVTVLLEVHETRLVEDWI